MPEFETIKTIPSINLGYGKFIEVSLKRSPQGNEFISISRGEYWSDGTTNGKRYQKSMTIPNNNGIVEGVINALTEINQNEIDKG